ncbi:MAG: DnaD domain protein [Lachnospiraceae bacterium]|nr:DnaD domain protein [Lachnospiraceae bacterium]
MRLFNDCPNTFVSVPSIFIDNYMTQANGEFVKVYLYLLRCMNTNVNCSVSSIADHFNHTEADILRALNYWAKLNVLALEKDTQNNICSIHFLDLTQSISSDTLVQRPIVSVEQNDVSSDTLSFHSILSEKHTEPDDSTIAFPEQATELITRKEYSLEEIQAFCDNPDIAELIFIIQSYLKYPLTPIQNNMLLFWMDELHHSKELIEYLVESCVGNGHSSFHYMNTIALDWANEGITTVEEAKEHSALHSKAYFTVTKSFGITGRTLTEDEMEYVHKWTTQYGFDLELIKEACKRTMNAIGKGNFKYTDSILTNWKKQNIHTLKDIATADANFNKIKKVQPSSVTPTKPNKFNNFNQRNYDFDQFEKVLLTTSV